MSRVAGGVTLPNHFRVSVIVWNQGPLAGITVPTINFSFAKRPCPLAALGEAPTCTRCFSMNLLFRTDSISLVMLSDPCPPASSLSSSAGATASHVAVGVSPLSPHKVMKFDRFTVAASQLSYLSPAARAVAWSDGCRVNHWVARCPLDHWVIFGRQEWRA